MLHIAESGEREREAVAQLERFEPSYRRMTENEAIPFPRRWLKPEG